MMMSGEFATISLSSITVKRADRVRRDPTEGLEEMKESLRTKGLIHPIVLDRTHDLVSGERRLTAAKALGWDRISFQYTDTLDAKELLAIELEENIKRKGVPWQEEALGIARYHELMKEMHPEGWTAEQTAREIGMNAGSISKNLSVAKELIGGNARVADAKKFSVALGITERKKERVAADISSLILGAELIEVEEGEAPPEEVLVADFNEWAPAYTVTPFNFINCDFPYGINADKFNQGAADAFGGYEDSEETYWKLVDTLLDHRDRLLGSSGHVLFWFSMRHYEKTLSRLREHFWVDPYPVIWWKTDNKGTLPDPSRGPRRVYEVAFVCSFGDRKVVQAVANTFGAPTVRFGEHMSEKSEEMLKHFFRMFIDSGSRVLDPTTGSGSALRAAKAMGAASVLGLEINPEFAESARRALR